MVSAILTYHSLDPSGSVISIAPGTFRGHMEALKEAGIPVVALSKIQQTPGGVAITFDDGFRNFLDHGAGVLEEFRYPATVFVVSGYCGRKNEWPSQPAGPIPRLELMDWDELRQISGAGIELGAHSVTHPFLSALPEATAEREMRDCRAEMEERIGRPVEAFAYPYGKSSPAVRRLAGEIFRQACGTQLRFVTGQSLSSDLPRLDAYYLGSSRVLAHLRSLPVRSYLSFRRLLRGFREVLSQSA